MPDRRISDLTQVPAVNLTDEVTLVRGSSNLRATLTALRTAIDTTLTQAQVGEMARDAIGAALVAGSNVSIAVSDPADTITISSSGLSLADVRNVLRDAVTGNTETNISVTWAAGTNTLNFAVDVPRAAVVVPVAPGTPAAGASVRYARADHRHPPQSAGEIVRAMERLAPGARLSFTHLDDTPVVPTQAQVEEWARDALAAALTAGANVTITADDAANRITVAASDPGITLAQARTAAQQAIRDAVIGNTESGITVTWRPGSGTLDFAVDAIPQPATTAPLPPGTAAVGTNTKYARSDHVHEAEIPAGGSAGQILKRKVGGGVEWGTEAAGGSPAAGTNLSVTGRDADSLEVASSTGTAAHLPAASDTQAGLLTAAGKRALDGGLAGPATETPEPPGTPAVGVSTKYAREDHVHGAELPAGDRRGRF